MNYANMTQRQPTAGSVEELVVNWINTQDDLATAQSFDGGWEHPAQMQIALLMKKYGNPGQTLKEKHDIYLTPKKRVDLFVQQEQPNANGHPNIGVELKCRTKRESKATFQNRVLEEIKKIHNGVKPEVRPVLMYSMAVTNSPMDLDWSTYHNTKYPDYPKSYFKVNGWYVIAWGGLHMRGRADMGLRVELVHVGSYLNGYQNEFKLPIISHLRDGASYLSIVFVAYREQVVQ